MKNKFSTISNYSKSKTYYYKSTNELLKKDNPIQRKTMYTQSKQNYEQFQQNNNGVQQEISTFKQLKQQIKYLQNSQFLSLKYNAPSQQKNCSFNYELPQFRITGKEFISQKKMNNLQKIKICLKTRAKVKKLNYLLDIKQILNASNDYSNYNCLNSFILKSNQQQTMKQTFLKKRYVPNFLKNKNKKEDMDKSWGQLNGSGNVIRGRRALSSKVGQLQKQNIIICCY